jgi:hypothetical protein
MYFKLLIISVLLVAVIMMALGIKLLFDKNARFEAHSCALEGGPLDETGACAGCQLKDLTNCPEKK